MEEKEKDERADPEEELILAKLRFVKAADSFEPLGFIKRKPLTSVGCALLAGFGLSSISKTASALPLIPLVMQISGIAGDALKFFKKHS